MKKNLDLFANVIVTDSILKDQFIEPLFSVLDTKHIDNLLIDKEVVFKTCSDIVKQEVNNKLMGWIFRRQLFKSINDNLFFYETIQNKIVGFCICRYLKKTKVISIDKIGVYNNYRSNGIGFKLLNKVKKLGFPIKLDVVKKNKRAVDFYERNGFYVISEKILGKDIEVLIMKNS